MKYLQALSVLQNRGILLLIHIFIFREYSSTYIRRRELTVIPLCEHKYLWCTEGLTLYSRNVAPFSTAVNGFSLILVFLFRFTFLFSFVLAYVFLFSFVLAYVFLFSFVFSDFLFGLSFFCISWFDIFSYFFPSRSCGFSHFIVAFPGVFFSRTARHRIIKTWQARISSWSRVINDESLKSYKDFGQTF